ncbi:exodeoxyribonuclease 7 small subunit [Enterobacter cloacae]|nr:exodeoxyribonuclease 7 small subunit [Enterobacter cloacae]
MACSWRARGQVKLQQAEQRVQILLSDSEDAKTTPFTPDAE